jgi:hypothetical protein
MQTTAIPEIEQNKELSSAVDAGNRFFHSFQDRFSKNTSVEWNLPKVPSMDPPLILTIRYRPEVKDAVPDLEVSATIERSEYGDRDRYERRLEKIWRTMNSKIGDFHLDRVREMLAQMDEE